MTVSYDYQTERAYVFTEDGQRLFLGIRDQVKHLLSVSGACTMDKATILPRGIGAASSWSMLACVDRLVELGEIREIPQQGNVHGQDRVFVSARYNGR